MGYSLPNHVLVSFAAESRDSFTHSRSTVTPPPNRDKRRVQKVGAIGVEVVNDDFVVEFLDQ